MKYSTSTITAENTIVPWLAAEGPLAYSPFCAPATDYFFLYNFILPDIFCEGLNLRRHYWFGDCNGKTSYHGSSLRDFWENSRLGNITPIFVHEPPRDLMHFEAPIAVFKYLPKWKCKHYYIFIQHGSYLEIPVSEQPSLEEGNVLLYRGIGTSDTFSIYKMPHDLSLIDQYRGYQSAILSNSVISFNATHAGTYRTETSHLSSCGVHPSDFPHLGKIHEGLIPLSIKANQCFTLNKECAKNKFGPSYVTFKTPVTNIRICTLSLDKLIPIEATRCKFYSI